MQSALDIRDLISPLRSAIHTIKWKAGGRVGPAPHAVKCGILKANGHANGTWVETGTYLGQTSAFLSSIGRQVYTLEPQKELFERAERKFAKTDKVTVLNGTSEEIFPDLLPKLAGPVNFWLDGHWSGGVTFLGEHVCPVPQELQAIEDNLKTLAPVCVMIDDVRLFGTEEGYPALDTLKDWAEKHGFSWRIEHDIFIMR